MFFASAPPTPASTVGLGITAACLVLLRGVRPLELLILPATFLLLNAGEWRIHRDLLHRRTPPLQVLYDRHTPQHHMIFVDGDMAIRDAREFRLVPAARTNGTLQRVTCEAAERGLAYRDLAVHVHSTRPVLDWLEEFTSPSFAPGPPGGVALRLDLDPVGFRAWRDQARPLGADTECFTLDQGHARVPLFTLGRRSVAFDEHARVFLAVTADGGFELRAESDHAWARIVLMRALREVATAHARALGDLPIHGAAVAARGRVVLFAGPKGAGKTSSLVHALHHEGVRYLANDRVLVELAADRMVARGLPTIIRLRSGTLELFPHVAERLRARRYQRHQRLADAPDPLPPDAVPRLSPPQLCALLGAQAIAAGPLAAVVLPEVDPRERGFALARLSPAEAASRLADGALIAQGTAASFFALPPGARRSTPPPPRSALAELARRVPCLICRLGPGAFQQPSLWEALDEAADRW